MQLTAEDILVLQNEQAGNDLSRRMFNPKLMAIRAQMPFIPIMPLPTESLAFKLDAGKPIDINFPSGTKIVMFSGNGEYFITRKGQAQVPTGRHDIDGSGALMNPEFCFFYVEEIGGVSAVAPFDMRLSVHCFAQL